MDLCVSTYATVNKIKHIEEVFGFGAPEFTLEVADGKIQKITVLRGSPCGSTWETAARIGLETQFFCTADPSGWDPMYGKALFTLPRSSTGQPLSKHLIHHRICSGN